MKVIKHSGLFFYFSTVHLGGIGVVVKLDIPQLLSTCNPCGDEENQPSHGHNEALRVCCLLPKKNKYFFGQFHLLTDKIVSKKRKSFFDLFAYYYQLLFYVFVIFLQKKNPRKMSWKKIQTDKNDETQLVILLLNKRKEKK